MTIREWWAWATEPSGSGNTIQGTTSGWLHWILEAPLPAHLLGAVFCVLWLALPFPLWLDALLIMATWQASKVDAYGWGGYGLLEVVPRLLIGLVGALLLVWAF